MIHNIAQLKSSEDALLDLYKALEALRADPTCSNTATFSVLAEGPLQEIRRIRAEIDDFTGISIAEREAAPLWLRLAGPKARWTETPASVLTAFLDALRKGVQSIATYNVVGNIGGRPPKEIQSVCDLELVGFAPGSFQVGMRLPEPTQLELFPGAYWQGAQIALGEFLSIARWAAAATSVEDLSEMFKETPKRRVLIRALKPFVPRRNGGVDFLELSGSAVFQNTPIRLSQETIDVLIKASDSAIDSTEERFEGMIREMDLDRQTFKLRDVPVRGEVACQFDDRVLPAAKEYLGSRVRVVGTRGKSGTQGRLRVVDMERVD